MRWEAGRALEPSRSRGAPQGVPQDCNTPVVYGGRMRNHRQSSRIGERARIEERRDKVFVMARDGMTTREIGKRLACSHVTVSRDLKARLRDMALNHPETRQYRMMMQARLEKLWTQLQNAVDGQDIKGIGQARALLDTQAKLLGLNIPAEPEPEALDTASISHAILEAMGPSVAVTPDMMQNRGDQNAANEG